VRPAGRKLARRNQLVVQSSLGKWVRISGEKWVRIFSDAKSL